MSSAARWIGADRTSARQLALWDLGIRITVVDDSAGDQSHAGWWLRFGDVRVMPFLGLRVLSHGGRPLASRPRACL